MSDTHKWAALTLGHLEAILDLDESQYRAARRGASRKPRRGAAAKLDSQARALRLALAKVPGMPALVRLLRGRDAATGEAVPTAAEVRGLRERLSQEDAAVLLRVGFPALASSPVEQLTLPDAADLLYRVQGMEAARRDAPAMRHALALVLDNEFWEALPSPEEALDNYGAWVADVLPGLPQLPEGKRRPCHERDHTFLHWCEKERMTPAKIRDRWNGEHPEAPVGKGEAGRDVVKKGLEAARRDRE